MTKLHPPINHGTGLSSICLFISVLFCQECVCVVLVGRALSNFLDILHTPFLHWKHGTDWTVPEPRLQRQRPSRQTLTKPKPGITQSPLSYLDSSLYQFRVVQQQSTVSYTRIVRRPCTTSIPLLFQQYNTCMIQVNGTRVCAYVRTS